MNASIAVQQKQLPVSDFVGVTLRCPRCTGKMNIPINLADLAVDKRECAICGWVMQAIDGIWRAVLPGRANQIAASLSAYEAVRETEGRWSEDPQFYRQLPWKDTTGRFASQWEIRARSFDFVREQMLPNCAKNFEKQRLHVLDLGAGNCWMSYRLALFGHLPVAVDIGAGRKDGLGAARHYEKVLRNLFPRFQAEMHCLPFADRQFDVAIYNASFHYAQDYEGTLREAVRVLRPGGTILIVDSPTYSREADGEAMKREKAAEFTRRFGTDSGGMGGQEYLTPDRLARLERVGIRWRRYSPWYGWRWAIRPLTASFTGRRRPSRFYVYAGTLAPGVTEAE